MCLDVIPRLKSALQRLRLTTDGINQVGGSAKGRCMAGMTANADFPYRGEFPAEPHFRRYIYHGKEDYRLY